MTHGMNAAEVESLGRLLQSGAERVRALCSELDSGVHGSTWAGPDADRFAHEWWPGHKSRLVTAAEQLHGFGQSALNNASEQRATSGEGGGATAVSRPPHAPAGPAPAPAYGGYPGWGGSIGLDRARELVNQYIPEGERQHYDFVNGDGRGDDWYQCTSWARARWRQMGYTGPDWHGDGGDVASNINRLLDRPDSNTPSVGAIFSDPEMVHVGVVEEMRTGPNGVVQFRVSEMNMGGDGWRDATPDEFRENRWVNLDASYRFAAFPG